MPKEHLDLYAIHLLRLNKDKISKDYLKNFNQVTGDNCNLDDEDILFLSNVLQDGLEQLYSRREVGAITGITKKQKEESESLYQYQKPTPYKPTESKESHSRFKRFSKKIEVDMPKEEHLSKESTESSISDDMVVLHKIFGLRPNFSFAKHFLSGLYMKVQDFKELSINQIIDDLNRKKFTHQSDALKATWLEFKGKAPDDDKNACLRYAKEIYLEIIDPGLKAPKISDPSSQKLRGAFRNTYEQLVKLSPSELYQVTDRSSATSLSPGPHRKG